MRSVGLDARVDAGLDVYTLIPPDRTIEMETTMTHDPDTVERVAKVRPLVWNDFSERSSRADVFFAACYMLTRWSDGDWRVSVSYPGYETSFPGEYIFGTRSAAKAAAQADYERRILSALLPQEGEG